MSTQNFAESTFPKVLILNGEPINYGSATGITLTNLFRDWPRDRIAQVYTARINPDGSVCGKNWRLSNADLFLIKWLFQANKTGEVSHAQNDKSSIPAAEVPPKSRALTARKLLAPWLDLLPYRLSPDFFFWLEEFSPDVIYSNLGNIRLVTIVDDLAQRLGIPFVPHFMDDWISTYSVPGKSLATALHKSIIERRTRHLLKRATAAIAIGSAMAMEYRARFGRHFDVFMNPVDVPIDIPFRQLNPDNMTGLCLVYVGGLHLSRFKNLIDIAHAISDLNREGHNLKFKIYAPDRDLEIYKELLEKPSVVFCSSIPPDEVQNILIGCDIAVHVESFSKNDARYTRLSVSTKIPQYFASALPVLAYGPASVASCQYIRDSGCGEVVGEQNIDLLKRVIRRLASNGELRAALGGQAWATANAHHDADKERERFRNVLSEAAFSRQTQSLEGF